MIALDTNVLLRLLLRDDPAQTAVTRQALETAEAADEAVLINDMVLAETVWTLASRYGVDKAGVLLSLRTLLETTTFVFENRANLLDAVERFAAAAVDFPDALIAVKNLSLGSRSTLTFDRAMRGLPGVKLLSTP